MPRTKDGPERTNPTNAVTLASAVSERWPPTRAHATRPRVPADSTTPPTTPRRELPLSGAGSTSRRASMGATRVAPHAGIAAATIVTPTPTARAAMRVRGSRATVVVGTSTPTSSSSRRMPTARPTPASRPSTVASSPTAAASTRMPPSTCRRVAPTARSRPTSRRRWATNTLKVFQMTKEPTSSDTAAKASSTWVKIAKPDCIAAAPSSASVAPLRTSIPCGTAAATRDRRSPASRPPPAMTEIWSTVPVLPSTCWAVVRSNPASVAPARLSLSPNPVMPTSVNARLPSCRRTRTMSPTT